MFGPSASVAKCFSSYRVPGHFAENQGEHYVSLEQVTDHNNGSDKEYEANDPGEGEISEDYANKMHIEQDVVNFEMSDTYAKSGPVGISCFKRTDIAVDIAKGLTRGSRTNKTESELQNQVDNGIADDGNKLMEVRFVSDVEIDLFTTRGNDECHIRILPNKVLDKI